MAPRYDTQNLTDLRIVASVGLLEDTTPVVDFVRKDGLVAVVENLEHLLSKNQTERMGKVWVQLSLVTEKLAYWLEDENNLKTKLALVEENNRLVEFYIKLSNALRPAYSVFGERVPENVGAVFKVLCCLVQFRNRRVTGEFLERFDFANKHFHQLFVPSRDNFDLQIVNDGAMRYSAVEFWLVLLRDVDFSIRKTMLTNFPLMNQFWKYLEMERYERLNEILAYLEEHVLGEVNYKRSTKCRILNENALVALRSLFALVTTDPRPNDNNDLLEFKTFKTTFPAFMNTLVSDRTKGLLFPVNAFGTPLTVNGVEFKINNKLLYPLLVTSRPWEDNLQMTFVMSILNSASELVAPYMAWIVSSLGGYHEPALSSYWIGHTLLYLEILKSPRIPFTYENVALLPLSKQAMTSCLAYPNDLVKQFALQLLHTLLAKIKRAGVVSALLVESIISHFPEYTALAPFLTHENKIIKLTATSIVALLEQVAPKSSSAATIATVAQEVAAIDLDSCTSFELVLLDKYLSIQSNNELRWWNKSGTHSFFTALLLLSKNSFLKLKVKNILDRLLRQSLAFNPKLVELPIVVLIDTISKTDSSAVPNLLDETISRCLKTPYKYLDQSSASYDKTSIFLVVLLEQVAYLRKNLSLDASVEEWLADFATQMVIIGEPLSGVKLLFSNFETSFEPDFSHLKLKKSVYSKMDMAETVMFLNQLRKPSSELLFDVFSVLGDFCMSLDETDAAISWLTDPATFSFLNPTEKLSDSTILAISLYNELLKQLTLNLPDLDLDKLASYLLTVLSTKQKTKRQNVLKNMLWLLSNEQLATLASTFENDMVVLRVYELFLERKVPFTPDLNRLLQIDSPHVDAILKEMTFSSMEEVSTLYEKPRFHFVFCENENNALLFTDFLLTVRVDDSLLYRIAAIYPKVALGDSKRVHDLALSMRNWHDSLKIFLAYPDMFSWEQVSHEVFATENAKNKNSMTALFASIVDRCWESRSADVWFHRAMLYATKKLAEFDELSVPFYDFLGALGSLLEKRPSFLLRVPAEIVQAQAEVVLGHKVWVRQAECLAHISRVLLAKLSFDKLMQMFITNEKMVLRLLPEEEEGAIRAESAQLLQKLFKKVTPNEGLLKQIVVLYNGTMTPEDLVLKEILVELEAKLMVSWIVHVTDWDFIKELNDNELELVGRVKLITADKKSFTVTLNKNYIMNTADGAAGLYAGERYDPEFLVQLILNNHELVSEVDGQLEFDLEAIIDTHVLRFIVSSLANLHIKGHCVIFMQGILRFLERITEKREKDEKDEKDAKDKNDDEEKKEGKGKGKGKGKRWRRYESEAPKSGRKSANFRHKNLLKVYLASILHTVKVADHAVPVVWHMVASFSLILGSPGHFLYDRVKNYILGTPVIKSYDVPLFHPIMRFMRHDKNLGEDNYYRQVAWLVDQLAVGVHTEEDVLLLLRRDVMEWVLNVMNLAAVNEKLRTKILKLVYNIQELALGGEMLVKRGTLTALETTKRDPAKLGCKETAHMDLNVDQVALRFGLLADKRVREWTNDDVLPAVKRIHGI